MVAVVVEQVVAHGMVLSVFTGVEFLQEVVKDLLIDEGLAHIQHLFREAVLGGARARGVLDALVNIVLGAIHHHRCVVYGINLGTQDHGRV